MTIRKVTLYFNSNFDKGTQTRVSFEIGYSVKGDYSISSITENEDSEGKLFEFNVKKGDVEALWKRIYPKSAAFEIEYALPA